MSLAIDDPDVKILVGDVLDWLTMLPDQSVDCIITSPPYYGLRDYGTGTWEGGDADCDHTSARRNHGDEKQASSAGTSRDPIRPDCRRCGATRIDQQIGLEATPDEHVTRLVTVFREARRVLADHGTLWLNYGDAYAGGGAGPPSSKSTLSRHGDNGRSPYLDALPATSSPRGSLPPKNLLGMPWRVAFALQADGWILRSDIIWAKPNPMPESVTDRPTKAHEYVFLFAKQPRYAYDADAIREESNLADTGWAKSATSETVHGNGQTAQTRGSTHRVGALGQGRNARTVWEIATQPFPEAHFATFPEELVRRCLLSGCPAEVCRTCGKARERIVERELVKHQRVLNVNATAPRGSLGNAGDNRAADGHIPGHHETRTLGWTDCGHGDYRPGTVLDPFMGSGTTVLVARKHGRHALGIELSEEYAHIAARRLAQQSLLA